MHVTHRLAVTAVVSLLTLFCSVPMLSQTEAAAISGRVADPQGLAVAGAKVLAINTATNVSHSTQTNGAGFYTLPGLIPGTYRVIVEKDGFAQIVKPDVKLHVQDNAGINFSLQVGSVTQSVTVEGGAPLVDTESGSVGTVVSHEFLRELPLNGRSFNTLLLLTPGVVAVRSDGIQPGQFSINGQRSNANYFVVDGVSANFGVSPFGRLGQTGGAVAPAFNAYGGTSSLASVDAVQEFRVETSTFAAEYGRTPGGQISIVTRSGTNDFHGGVFEYFRNEKLDANDWFANAAGLERAPLRQNDFGGFLGGPILRNKTFFFVSYEGLRLRLPQTTVISVPSMTLRSSALPAIRPLFEAYPVPNGPVAPNGIAAQFTGVYSNSSSMNAGSVRIDHTLSSALALFVRYNEAPSERRVRVNSLSQTTTTEVSTRTLTLGAVATVSPRVTNTFRGSYSYQEAISRESLDSFAGAVPPDLALLKPSPVTSGSFAPIGFPFYTDATSARNRERQVNLVDYVALTAGSHVLQFGVDYLQSLPRQGGNISAFFVAVSPSAFASTGVATLLFTTTVNPAAARFNSLSLYAQDSWKVTPRLALTYGLRWEFNPAPSAVDDTNLAAWSNVNDAATTVLAAPGTPLWKSRHANFAPRVGIAYQLTSKGDLVIRGGWGLFYDLGTGQVGVLLSAFPNIANRFNFGVAMPVADIAPLIPPTTSAAPYQSPFIFGFSPDLKLPRSQHWNVAVEQAVGSSSVMSLTYVGQVSRNLLRQSTIQPSPANPNFAGVLGFSLTENGDTSDYHALQLQYRTVKWKALTSIFNYTWSHSIDTNSSDIGATVSQGIIDVAADRGRSSFDVRHNFSSALLYELPAFKGRLGSLAKNWSFSTMIQARSGVPIDVTTQAVTLPGTNSTPIRPDLVSGEPIWITDNIVGGGRRLNPDAFSIPSPPRQGTLGRNAIEGFGLWQVDFSVARAFRITETLALKFEADLFNIFNHPNFSNPSGNLDFGALGLRSTQMVNRGLGGLDPLYQAGGPRSVQFVLRLTF